MTGTVRVYVNARGIDVPAGATALEAVHGWQPAAAEELKAGRTMLTDSRGLPADPHAPVWSGAIFRLVPARSAGTSEPVAAP